MTFLQQTGRNGVAMAGLLLLMIGAGDLIAGRAKLGEYRALLAEAPPIAPRDPAALFPKASEAQERYAVAKAKLAFYELLVLVGQLLVVAGFLLLGLGLFRQRLRTARAAPLRARFH